MADFVEELKRKELKLKYLFFVHTAVALMKVNLLILYNFAKNHAGPLRAGIQVMEGIAKDVFGPLYERIIDAPLHLLQFLDEKVDKVLGGVWNQVPSVFRAGPELALSIISDVQKNGVLGTPFRMAHEARENFQKKALDVLIPHQPLIEKQAAAAWHSLNQLPILSQIAQATVPTAASLTGKYNEAVGSAAAKGYGLAGFLPIVPLEGIAKIFGKKEQ